MNGLYLTSGWHSNCQNLHSYAQVCFRRYHMHSIARSCARLHVRVQCLPYPKYQGVVTISSVGLSPGDTTMSSQARCCAFQLSPAQAFLPNFGGCLQLIEINADAGGMSQYLPSSLGILMSLRALVSCCFNVSDRSCHPSLLMILNGNS